MDMRRIAIGVPHTGFVFQVAGVSIIVILLKSVVPIAARPAAGRGAGQAMQVVVGWLEGKRRILGVWETAPEMKAGNVAFRQVYKAGEAELSFISRKRA